MHAIVAKARFRLHVFGMEFLALADLPFELLERKRTERREARRVDVGIFQRLDLFPEDEGDGEIIFLEARPEADGDQVAGRTAICLVVIIISFSRQAFLNQLVIEALECRMLHDRENVDHVGGCLSAPNELAVFPLYVVIFIAAPHQAQAAPDRLFKQDAGA